MIYPSFVFIRHGQSDNSTGLFDPGLTPQGKQQSKMASGDLKLEMIDVVVVSPLKRALETCMILFGPSQNVRVYVQPLLTEKITRACDIGANIKESRQMFGHRFDFSKIPEGTQENWYVHQILPMGAKDEIMLKFNQSEGKKNIHEITLEYLKENGQIESPLDMIERVGRMKKVLAEYRRNSLKNVALVGHDAIFQGITATSFHENGKPINGVLLSPARSEQIAIIMEGEIFQQESFVPFCKI